jgi:UDP-glucose 4-epimerase
MRYVALRYFNVAGADPTGRYGQSTTKTTLLVQIAVQCALGLRPGLEIFGTDYETPDGTCIRDYLHVTDLIDAHLSALEHLRAGRDNVTLNVGYGHGYSVRDIIDTVKRISGVDFPVKEGPRRLGDPVEVVADARRIRETFGWEPKLDNIETIVTHALQWEREMERKRTAGILAGAPAPQLA